MDDYNPGIPQAQLSRSFVRTMRFPDEYNHPSCKGGELIAAVIAGLFLAAKL